MGQAPRDGDKLLQLVLGQYINTKTMTVAILHDYLHSINNQLEHWHGHGRSFTIHEIKIQLVIGKLTHAAETIYWLKHLMACHEQQQKVPCTLKQSILQSTTL